MRAAPTIRLHNGSALRPQQIRRLQGGFEPLYSRTFSGPLAWLV